MEGRAASQPVRVDTRLVREQLVGRILALAMDRRSRPPELEAEPLRGALARVRDGGEQADARVATLGDELATLGYSCREAELELFEAAREPIDEFAAEVHGREPIEVAAELAAAEPGERPDPGEAPSWRVPGPGGHVRHYLAMDGARALWVERHGEGSQPEGITGAELKRCWMLGFFLRCCEQVSGRPP